MRTDEGWQDVVAKGENRVTLKMSRTSIFSNLQRRKALYDRYDGLWSFLHETIPHVAAWGTHQWS
jgi:hypothetical protein